MFCQWSFKYNRAVTAGHHLYVPTRLCWGGRAYQYIGIRIGRVPRSLFRKTTTSTDPWRTENQQLPTLLFWTHVTDRRLIPGDLPDSGEKLGLVLEDTYCSMTAARFQDGGQRCSGKSSSLLQIYHSAGENKKEVVRVSNTVEMNE